jgi:hypothetical protein
MGDTGFQATLARRSEFQMQDCWGAFSERMQKWPAWAGPKWLPEIEDCVACRVRTTGIQEEEFKVCFFLCKTRTCSLMFSIALFSL